MGYLISETCGTVIKKDKFGNDVCFSKSRMQVTIHADYVCDDEPDVIRDDDGSMRIVFYVLQSASDG